MTVGQLIKKLQELDADDLTVKAPGPPPDLPDPSWFTGGIVSVMVSTDDQYNPMVFLIPDVSG